MLKLKVFNYQIGEFEEKTLVPEMNQSEWIVGRSSTCDLVLVSPEVSRVHGRIEYDRGQYYYTDFGSTDGSRINNEEVKINQKYLLKKDDIIRIGNFVLAIAAMETASDQQESDLIVRCIRIVQETEDVKTFSFVADPSLPFSFLPGQFVTLELEIKGKLVRRAYSISSPPSRPHTLDITVKRVPPPPEAPQLPPGLVSNWLHDNLKVGSQVKLCGAPMGKFTCGTHPPQKLLMISAGSGITPMLSMARWLYDTAAKCDLVFFHSARSPRDLIMRQELELMASRQPNFRLAITITQLELGQPWLGFTGRLTETMLLNVAPDFRDRAVYVCGSDRFMQGVKAMLASLDFPMENYHEESFGIEKKPKQEPKAERKRSQFEERMRQINLQNRNLESDSESKIPFGFDSFDSTGTAKTRTVSQNPKSKMVRPSLSVVQPASAKPVVVFAQSGQEISCDEEESILAVAEQNNIKIRAGCRQGVCGACKKRKLEGQVKYQTEPDGLDKSEQEQGYILPCVAFPVGKVAIEA